jgi:CRP/FNR family transcriptional regulator, cyclic AMP receptor protein
MRKALHLLGILDDVDIDWLATQGSVRHVNAGSALILEKKPIDSVYILLDGELSVWVGGPKRNHIATLLPGEIVGEISFVDSHPPSASVSAVTDSQVLAISRELLTAKLAADQGFAKRFYQSIATFLADRLYVTVGRFGYGSPQQDADLDELPETSIDEIDLATVRFDKLLRRLGCDWQARSASY